MLDHVAEVRELGCQAGDAEGGGTHVHAAAALAQVERDADYSDRCHRPVNLAVSAESAGVLECRSSSTSGALALWHFSNFSTSALQHH